MIGDKIALWLLRAITALAIALTALVFSGSACAGALPKVERDGSAVIHLMWETKL